MTRFQSIIGALSTGLRNEAEPSLPQHAFITISRQAGAGGHTLQEKLVERLNKFDPPSGDEPTWAGVDKEIVELVAGDDEAFARLVDSLGDQSRTWLDDLFSHMIGGNTTEYKAYRRTARALRALAQRGRVILIGRGSVFITRDMPMGVHIQLVAPLDDRIEYMRRKLNVSYDEAEDHVRTIDRNREAFFSRYWPNEQLSAESFTATFNTTQATDDEIADAVLALIPTLDVELTATPIKMQRKVGVFQTVAP